ncbi:unconventional myosin-IXb isoform X2 [Oreochromis niloticus]|uniref:unconventional myosin-IXb isoform X2 n=1 Tax=Oreochromis niloticus TaxID=8128 RepID=UPI000393EE7F|nr:unconventional myosin-IXb isoform X2 [Oreochromis niloticus]
MTTTDGSGALEHDEEARVVQIYPRVSYDTAAYCPLQISVGDTVASVIHNAVVTLDLDPNQTYDLLEVRKSGGKERPLKAGDSPLERVLLWPTEAQKWHPQSKGYYFILQQQQQQVNNGGFRAEISTGECDDLCSLSTLTEENVLEVLRQRFYKHKIYTYANKILIAINPNKFLPVYYNPMYVKMYENQPLGKLSPHIFAIADVTFRAMLNRQANQCIVITGESGSGKTESSSYLIHCLTSLSQNMYSSGLERTILGSGPVLEAFGNAKTTKNNNSSRFGKFIQLNYLESGVIRGAVIEKYLLEKCRVVTRDKSERNFHVFYYLLMGASKEEQEELHLLKPQDYLYLKQEELLLDDEEKLGQEYRRLHQAMEMVGFLPSTKKHIFSILSALLHLGNVTFTQSEDPPGLEVGPPEVLSILSDLLKVEEESLVNTLIKRKMITASFTIALPYTLDEAVAMRDSMAKSLYGALFDWIILHINHATMNRRDMEESVSCLSIGVLDMFGFENLQSNSFEQLCINYANETLQCYINQNIFRLEQEEFAAEGIAWKNIEFSDNTDCVQLFDKKSIGLFDLLEKESSLTEATDKSLLDKIKKQHRDNPYFKPSPHTEPTFVIQHFAGRVKYHIKDFRKKNTEHMRPDVISLLRSSERSFIHHLVASSPEAQFRWGVLRAAVRILTVFKKLGRRREELTGARRKSLKEIQEKRRSTLTRLSSTSTSLDFSFDHSDERPVDVFDFLAMGHDQTSQPVCSTGPKRRTKSGRQKQVIPKNLVDLRSLRHIIGLTGHDLTSKSIFHPHRKSNPSTVGCQFQASLTTLMDRIVKAEPFFIFCVCANAEKKELCFDDKLVLNQIRYTGLLQIVHIQKSGYSAKYTFEEFVEKFRILFPQGTAATPEHITALFERMDLDKKTYQIGKTKVFLKEKERQLLQDTLNKEVMRCIITLQRWFRTCLIRFHFLEKRDATMIIQRRWRQFSLTQNRTATLMQAAWRTSMEASKHTEWKQDDSGSQDRVGRESFGKRELKRQEKMELSPNRMLQPDPVDSHAVQRDRSKEKRQGRSPPSLTRPFSVPVDLVSINNDPTSNTKGNTPLRYKDIDGFKEKAERWKDRHSEEDSGSEVLRQRNHRRNKFHNKKSMSADELSKISSSGSDSSSSVNEITDGSRFCIPIHYTNEDSVGHHDTSTPDRTWSLGKFLRKMAPRISPSSESPTDKAVTLSKHTSHSNQTTNQNSAKSNRNPTIRISRATRALQWDSSLDQEVTDTKELRNLDEFLGNQVNELQTRKDLSPAEMIFLTATMQFRENIKGMYSVQKPQIRYKDLMKSFHNKVTTLAGSTEKGEVPMVVNLFQSVLDGFIRATKKQAASEPAKTLKKRRKKDKSLDSPLDHLFSTYQVNIMQSCDLCGSYIWGMEKAYMCSACKLICHKKCLSKIITDCSTRCARQDGSLPASAHFGVQVCVLTSKANPVPIVMETLLMHVELHGLYTEGIYRKSGSACRAKELHQVLQKDPETVCLDNYPIHTISGLIKRWLRELPDPLMTFSLYHDFLHAVELPEEEEKIKAVYQKIEELPPANFSTLERLIFHLVRVAKEEEHNKMSPSALAIVFAPCILRSPDSDDPLLCMKDVSRTTLCVEILITEQFRRYNEKMQNIQELEHAEAMAVNQLRLRRQATVVEQSELQVPEITQPDEAVKTLLERIKSIKQEKLDLVSRLPELDQEESDNENLDFSSWLSTDSLDRLGSMDSEGNSITPVKTQKPDCPPKPADLTQRVRHLMVQSDHEQKKFTSGEKADVIQPSVNTPSPASKPQIASKKFNGSSDDLDIPYIDEDEDLNGE